MWLYDCIRICRLGLDRCLRLILGVQNGSGGLGIEFVGTGMGIRLDRLEGVDADSVGGVIL